MWVRGLKLIDSGRNILGALSHPVWVRGLKHLYRISFVILLSVAPRVGAWIETVCFSIRWICLAVAPRVGAWIETHHSILMPLPLWRRTPCGCVD